MRVSIKALSLLLTLSACQGTAYIPQEVKIPVTQRCDVKMPEAPNYSLPQTPADAQLFDKVKAALSDIELYKGYTAELEAAVKACQP